MNCPLNHYECSLCSYLIGDSCTESGVPISIFDLMTHEELVKYMNPVIPEFSKKQWDFVRQLEARLLHTEQKLKELQVEKIDKNKPF